MLPNYLIFQGAVSLFGKNHYYLHNTEESFRRNNHMLITRLGRFGFIELNEYLLTVGRGVNPRLDGLHYFGTVMQMKAMVFVNMICNGWWSEQHMT